MEHQDNASNAVRVSTESTRPAQDALFDYLPSSQEEYAIVEKRLIRRIDWTLMPVMISMIVLKYVAQHEAAPPPHSDLRLIRSAAISIATPCPMRASKALKRI